MEQLLSQDVVIELVRNHLTKASYSGLLHTVMLTHSSYWGRD